MNAALNKCALGSHRRNVLAVPRFLEKLRRRPGTNKRGPEAACNPTSPGASYIKLNVRRNF